MPRGEGSGDGCELDELRTRADDAENLHGPQATEAHFGAGYIG